MERVMPILWYCAGSLTALVFLLIGYNLGCRHIGEAPPAALPAFPGFKRATTRKKPKSPNELDEWKREQRQIPLDPGLG